MRMPAILLVSGLSALALGCSVDVLHYGAKNLVYTPCSRLNGAKECVKANVLAEESWRRFQACTPETRYSKDFADGYVFGFADYVEKGGPGIPPVVAPLRYRKVHYETPEGHQQLPIGSRAAGGHRRGHGERLSGYVSCHVGATAEARSGTPDVDPHPHGGRTALPAPKPALPSARPLPTPAPTGRAPLTGPGCQCPLR